MKSDDAKNKGSTTYTTKKGTPTIGASTRRRRIRAIEDCTETQRRLLEALFTWRRNDRTINNRRSDRRSNADRSLPRRLPLHAKGLKEWIGYQPMPIKKRPMTQQSRILLHAHLKNEDQNIQIMDCSPKNDTAIAGVPTLHERVQLICESTSITTESWEAVKNQHPLRIAGVQGNNSPIPAMKPRSHKGTFQSWAPKSEDHWAMKCHRAIESSVDM